MIGNYIVAGLCFGLMLSVWILTLLCWIERKRRS